jgi:hypothetical protein
MALAYTRIPSLDQYLLLLEGKSSFLALYESGSVIQGLSDKYSDRDFTVIWDSHIPDEEIRMQIANKLGLIVHDIRDVTSINQSFDLFSDGKELFNVHHMTEEQIQAWHDTLFAEEVGSRCEDVLLAVTSLNLAKVYVDRNNAITSARKLCAATKEVRERIIAYEQKRLSQDLVLLERDTVRQDPLQYIHHVYSCIRLLQLIYCLQNDLPILGTKHLEKIATTWEDTSLSKILHTLTKSLSMDTITNAIMELAGRYDVTKAEKLRA